MTDCCSEVLASELKLKTFKEGLHFYKTKHKKPVKAGNVCSTWSPGPSSPKGTIKVYRMVSICKKPVYCDLLMSLV